MPSFYQGDMYRALAKTGRVDLHVVYARGIPQSRQDLGWSTDVSGYESTMLNARWRILDAMRLAWKRRGDVHIVNGLWAEPAFAAALIVLALRGSAYAIYSEGIDPRITWGRLQSTIRMSWGRIIGARATGWFPISRFAVELYRRFGVRSDTMYPLGYFRAAPIAQPLCMERGVGHGPIKLLFVGQIVERKGIDLLLAALADLQSEFPDIILSLIGDGPMRDVYERRADAFGVAHRVHFEGVLPAQAIPSRISSADVLVLPSRWDGWGLVVNEALVSGTPVIVSDRCGAAEVIQQGVNGYVFRSDDAADLAASLRSFLARRRSWCQMRLAASDTGQTLTTQVVAPYFADCIEHMLDPHRPHPVPPWANSLSDDVALQ